MIEITRLQASEFDLLGHVSEGFMPDPDRSIVIVAKSESKIVGRLLGVHMFHLEGAWIEESRRGGSAFKDMMNAMEIESKAEGISKLLTYVTNPVLGTYITRRCGYVPLAVQVYAKELT